jgi:hypothetical protein
MEEDGAGRATRVVPLNLQPHGVEEDIRYRQIIASKVFPSLQIDTYRVQVPNGHVFLIAVPPSTAQPHAVLHNDSRAAAFVVSSSPRVQMGAVGGGAVTGRLPWPGRPAHA